MCFAYMYVFTLHACSALRAQEMTLDPLELEVELVVSSHVGPGN